MVTSYDIVVSYKQHKPSKKPIRIPSEETYRNRLGVKSLYIIDRTSGYFNTIYSNLNLDLYIKCGFELFKTFNYTMLLHPKILERYKKNDKTLKRLVKTSNNRIFDSFTDINLPLRNYCKKYVGKQKLIITAYLQNEIDSIIVVYCIHNKLVTFNDIEEDYLYNIFNQYDDWVRLMFRFEDYIEELDKENRFED